MSNPDLQIPLDADPNELFEQWFEEAKNAELKYPNAMAVATVDESGMPDVRMVLLKGRSENGFVFYTNFEGRKGQQILENPKAACMFYWEKLDKQVRVRGSVEVVDDEEADAYFNSRPRGSRLGAWASDQSQPMETRDDFIKRLEGFEKKFPGEEVPRPPHWSGFRIVPDSIEFWYEGEFRLHHRVLFERDGESWKASILYP